MDGWKDSNRSVKKKLKKIRVNRSIGVVARIRRPAGIRDDHPSNHGIPHLFPGEKNQKLRVMPSTTYISCMAHIYMHAYYYIQGT